MIGQGTDSQMNQEKEETQKSLHDEGKCLTPDQLSIERKAIHCKQLGSESQKGMHWQDKEQIESRNHVKEGEQKLKHELEEKICDITCGVSNMEIKQKCLSTDVYQKGERCSSFGGAINFYLGREEEYTVCEQFFSLSNFDVRN